MTHPHRRSAKDEAEYCRSLGDELAGSHERALIINIARAFEELADAEPNVPCVVKTNATRNALALSTEQFTSVLRGVRSACVGQTFLMAPRGILRATRPGCRSLRRSLPKQ